MNRWFPVFAVVLLTLLMIAAPNSNVRAIYMVGVLVIVCIQLKD